MKLHASLLAAACALALSACGGESRDAADTAATPTPTTTSAADGSTGAATSPATDTTAGQMPGDASTTAAGDMGGTAGTTGATTDAGTAAPSDAATADTGSQAAAGAGGCSIDMEGNDRMQFNVNSIVVPSSCTQFTINLTHTGQLPEAAMGHNVVITSTSNMAAVSADGIAAGASAGYVKSGDDRIIAATEMIGGGESTSVTFDVSKIKDGGPYQFFCSFPGHAALMKGTISVG